MSLFAGLFTNTSSLRAQSQNVAMISDNIANLNTISYKQAVAHFRTISSGNTGSETYAPGGVRARAFQEIDSVIAPQVSDRNTYLAIDGAGFFVVSSTDANTVSSDYAFTRHGQFTKDKNGRLVNGGNFLKGWPVNSSGVPEKNGLPLNVNVLSSLETVNISDINGVSRATNSVRLAANLPSEAAIGSVVSTTVRVYDSLGASHDLNINYTLVNKTPLQWDITITTNNPLGDVVRKNVVGGDVVASPQGVGQSPIRMQFDSNGNPQILDLYAANVADQGLTPNLFIDWGGTSASNSTISLFLGEVGKPNGLTSQAGAFANTSQFQDGVQFGNFSGVSIDTAGLVVAQFENGEQLAIYRIPVVKFSNPNALQPRSGNIFTATQDSGATLLSTAGQSGTGKILSSSLEGSAVDYAVQMMDIVVAVQAYAGAIQTAKSIQEMLKEIADIKR